MIAQFILYIAGVSVFALVAYGLYDYFDKGGTIKSLTVDALVEEAKSVVSKLETYVETEAKKVEAIVIQKTGLETMIETINADIQKAKDFTDKIKSIL